MTRRERLERKAELRREWAEKRKDRAATSFNAARAATEHIPMGQPILIGHHSEGRHRAAIARSDRAMRAGCENADMAAHHARKAEGIERQLERCVFSDDPDAVESLQAKIDRAEKLQETMTAANKIVRRKPKNESTPEKMAELVAIGLTETQARQLFVPDFAGRIGFHELTNNNANIRRMKERVKIIEANNARKAAAESSPDGVTIEGSEYVRVTFAEKPEREVLNALKAAGFYWQGGSWCGARARLPATVADLTA